MVFTQTLQILSKPKVLRNLAFEFGPLLIFVGVFHFGNPYEATTALIAATLISTVCTFIMERRIPFITLYITLLTIAFGYLTIHRHSIHFLQMRDSVYDFTLGATLLIGLMLNKNLLEFALSSFVTFSRNAWTSFTQSWIGYFFVCGALNEYVRTHYRVNDWLTFKITMVLVTFVFTLLFVYRALKKTLHTTM